MSDDDLAKRLASLQNSAVPANLTPSEPASDPVPKPEPPPETEPVETTEPAETPTPRERDLQFSFEADDETLAAIHAAAGYQRARYVTQWAAQVLAGEAERILNQAREVDPETVERLIVEYRVEIAGRRAKRRGAGRRNR